MAEFGGMDTWQVELETRPEQAGGRSEPEPEAGCANCGAVLGDSDGSTYCRRCEWWIERDER